MNTAFQKTAASDEWYTPKELVDALGVFDLDPCAPVHPLWKTATRMLNKEDDGLKHDWGGYGSGSIRRIRGRSLSSSSRRWWTMGTVSPSYTTGSTIRCAPRRSCRMQARFYSCATGFGSFSLMEREAAALGMAVCWSPSGSPTQKSSGTAASRVSL